MYIGCLTYPRKGQAYGSKAIGGFKKRVFQAEEITYAGRLRK